MVLVRLMIVAFSLIVLIRSIMEFIEQQTDTGREWGADYNPFEFWFAETEGVYDIVVRYGSVWEEYTAESLEEAKTWCYRYDLKNTLRQLEGINPDLTLGKLLDYYSTG
jgi:hypothetical protein